MPVLRYCFFVFLCCTFFSGCRNFRISGSTAEVIPYDDRIETSSKGNSEVFAVETDSTGLLVRYVLRPGFSYPYAGVLFFFKTGSGKSLDCTRFDALKLRIASKQQSDCKMYLTVFDEKFSRENEPITERFLEKDCFLEPAPKTIVIPFDQFRTPDWWFQKNNITLKDVGPVDFSKVTALKIESGSTAKTGIVDTLIVSDVRFIKRTGRYVVIPVALFLVFAGVFFVHRLTPRKKKNPVIITYEKKEMPSYRDINAQRISDYLAKHFSEPDISIVTAGVSLGLSQKKIASIMNTEFKLSFKRYLTSIRIHEAKRLLLETDRLVIDIALGVGFSTISHFNRVFKTTTQISPLEFRNRRGVSERL